MDSIDVKTIRRFAIRSKRWVFAYTGGLSDEPRAFAEKQYKSHRSETGCFCKIGSHCSSLVFYNRVTFKAPQA